MDYEVRGNRVITHSADCTVIIDLTYEGELHLGSAERQPPLVQLD